MDDSDTKVLTLEPLSANKNIPHQTVFINELKLSEFKQALARANIPSEVQTGVLLCCNGTVAIRRVSKQNKEGYFNSFVSLNKIDERLFIFLSIVCL